MLHLLRLTVLVHLSQIVVTSLGVGRLGCIETRSQCGDFDRTQGQRVGICCAPRHSTQKPQDGLHRCGLADDWYCQKVSNDTL